MPDDYILCCAARVCCQDNSPEQIAAVAAIILADMPEKDRTVPAVRRMAEHAAETIVKHFELHDRRGRTTKADFHEDTGHSGE